jgi:hypothetical protein
MPKSARGILATIAASAGQNEKFSALQLTGMVRR